MAQIRGYLVDVINDVHGERTIEDKLSTYYSLLHCSCIDITPRRIGKDSKKLYEIVCDDEGLLKPYPIVSALDNNHSGALVGNLFIAGPSNDEGELTSLSDADIAHIEQHFIEISTLYHRKPYKVLKEVDF